MDPSTQEISTLFRDMDGDFVSTGTMGAVDDKNGLYFTLLQPSNGPSIQLGRFDIAKRSKTILPLENTITNGHFVNGRIIGVDEGDVGVYFAIIDPDTGNTVAKNILGKEYNFDLTPSIAVDPANHTAYCALSHEHGGNIFHLFAVDTSTGKFVRDPITLHPTPDLQGPEGLTYIGNNLILAFMPPVSGGWGMVVIDALTGRVTSVPVLPEDNRLFVTGAGWLIPRTHDQHRTISQVFGAMPGSPQTLYSVDIDCAMEGGHNCTTTSPWPHYVGDRPPTDLGVYNPTHGVY